MHRLKIYLSIIFFFNVFSGKADVDLPVKRLKFESITINDGLSQGMVNCLLHDSYGFMWFATKDGLNRYDGYRFVVYRHDAADSTTISDNFVTGLFEDSRQNLWVATSGNGVDMFDRKSETFVHFRHDEKNPNSLSNNRIWNLGEDKFGNIWVGTEYGLNRITIIPVNPVKDHASFYEKNKVTFKKIQLNPANPSQELFTRKPGNDLGLNSMHVDQDGKVWVSTYDLLFNIIPMPDGNDKIIPLDVSHYFSWPFTDKGMESHVHAFCEDTVHHKLYLISSFCISEVDLHTGKPSIISSNRFYTGFIGLQAAIDSKGMLWFNESDRLIQFDVNKKQAARILTKEVSQEEMTSNVNVCYVDKSGIIWVGTKGYGLLKYNDQSARFHHSGNASIRWMSAINDSILGIIQSNNHVHLFNCRAGVFTDTLPAKGIKGEEVYNKIGYVDSYVRDSDGTYWFAKGSLMHYDHVKERYSMFPVSHYTCYPVFLDNKNDIWAGTETAFSRFDRVNEKFVYYPIPVPVSHNPYTFIQKIYQDGKGIFWLGTISGLLRFDPVNQSWKQFKNIPSDPSSLSFDLIISICADPHDPENYLWIGTNGGGLNRLDKRTGKCIRLTEKNGLPNNVIYGIVDDDNGNLWLSTNKGLSCFNPQLSTFKNYEIRDGLQSNEFNRYAYGRTPSGIIFFGGVNGFNYFNPRDLRNNPFIPNVLVTDVKLKNRSINLKDKNAALQEPAYLTHSFTLDYNDNVITFEFASMEFSAPDKNVYQYMMEGFDREWVQAGAIHSATYTNLDPGTYFFKVKGSNNDGVWNQDATTIKLLVLPPWYMTWWFRMIMLLAVISAVYAFYRSRLNHALKLQAVRGRIAQDLHDEIGSNLSTISIFADMATTKANGKREELVPLLRKISDYTQTSMEGMSDIVWMINSRNDRFENIIIRMRTLAAELFEAKSYQLHLDFDEELNPLKMGMDERKNFYLIYKEALNNIAKYAEGKNVWIEMKWNHSSVLLKIKDDGSGFDMQREHTGNGLINMQKRAEVLKGELKLESAPGNGTALTLQFAL